MTRRGTTTVDYSVVIPTLGRPSLLACLEALATSRGPAPQHIVLVDDRPDPGDPLEVPASLYERIEVVVSGGVGPAAARNVGWRRTATPWVVFLDDDVRVTAGWRQALAADLTADRTGLDPGIAGVQGTVEVPQPSGRRPTDWERGTADLAQAHWITADMAFRREALVESGGFDERFPRAFREDADLALRLTDSGWRLRKGRRRTLHPVRPASPWVSLRTQVGNADDALMHVLHGPRWYERAGETPGRRARHLAITLAGAAAAALGVTGRRRAAGIAGAAALAGVAEFAWARIAPGPRTTREITTMAATSLLIPPAATWHWLRGALDSRGARPWPPPARAILFDRDGTLIRDVPYNGDPLLVEPLPGAREALDLARSRGLQVGVVTNQSAIGRGVISADDAAKVNARLAELLGPFHTWQICPHAPEDDCDCRKPLPGMLYAAADELGVEPHECVMVGDIGADVVAARAAGARSVLLPTPVTGPEERAGARVMGSLAEAVRFALGEDTGPAIWS